MSAILLVMMHRVFDNERYKSVCFFAQARNVFPELKPVAKMFYISDILISKGLIQQRLLSKLIFHLTLISTIIEKNEEIQTKYREIFCKKKFVFFTLMCIIFICWTIDFHF